MSVILFKYGTCAQRGVTRCAGCGINNSQATRSNSEEAPVPRHIIICCACSLSVRYLNTAHSYSQRC